ncbi:head decoration protein [Maricaulis sp.]|uniref:head decoration protein n=1 Tax=Maricaulis sp. TaxID=1486257 RepID=UPI003A90EEEE
MSLASYKATRPALLGDLLKVFDHNFSLESGTVADDVGADGRTDEIGTVYGAVLFGTPTVEAGEGNTGQGTVGSMALKAAAQLGDYTLECIAESNGAATFAVFDPAGNRLADATEAAAYSNEQIGFTIGTNSPTTEYDVGDSHVITVPAGSGQFLPIDFDAVDGTQRFAAICGERTVVPAGATQRAKIVKRQAVVTDSKLIWPEGATADQKAAALVEASAQTILTRTGV